MLLSSRQQLRLLIKPKSSKTIGLFLTAAAVVFSLASVLRYNAKASEFLTAPSASISSAGASSLEESSKQDSGEEIAPNGIYRFSMEVIGAASEYEVFELEIAASGLDANVTLRSQLRNGLLQEDVRSLDERAFREFWQRLRSLETAQLRDLSPYTEAFLLSLNSSSVVDYKALEAKQTAIRDKALSAEASATYRFTFQDGLHDYPNSFEVYAPETLEDDRYLQVKDLAAQLAEETFELAH